MTHDAKCDCLGSAWFGCAERSMVERYICGLAAGPLPAHPRGTRRKYVPVGSLAASMPPKVPRGWAGKDLPRGSVCVVRAVHCVAMRMRWVPASGLSAPASVECDDDAIHRGQPARRAAISFLSRHRPSSLRGVLAACGTLGGMDLAKEPQGWVHGVSRKRRGHRVLDPAVLHRHSIASRQSDASQARSHMYSRRSSVWSGAYRP